MIGMMIMIMFKKKNKRNNKNKLDVIKEWNN